MLLRKHASVHHCSHKQHAFWGGGGQDNHLSSIFYIVPSIFAWLPHFSTLINNMKSGGVGGSGLGNQIHAEWTPPPKRIGTDRGSGVQPPPPPPEEGPRLKISKATKSPKRKKIGQSAPVVVVQHARTKQTKSGVVVQDVVQDAIAGTI